jgi:hypothetical protein
MKLFLSTFQLLNTFFKNALVALPNRLFIHVGPLEGLTVSLSLSLSATTFVPAVAILIPQLAAHALPANKEATRIDARLDRHQPGVVLTPPKRRCPARLINAGFVHVRSAVRERTLQHLRKPPRLSPSCSLLHSRRVPAPAPATSQVPHPCTPSWRHSHMVPSTPRLTANPATIAFATRRGSSNAENGTIRDPSTT